MMKLIAFLIVTLAAVNAQKIYSGACPSVTPMANFNITQYAGKWYEWGKYPNFFQLSGHCDIVSYAANPDGTYTITDSHVAISDGSVESDSDGTLRIDNNAGNGQLAQSFSDVTLPFGVPYWAPYIVLGTDYSSYSVVYTCQDFFFFHAKYVWIYTRTRFVMPPTIDAANAVLDANKIDHSNPTFLQTDQLMCPLTW